MTKSTGYAEGKTLCLNEVSGLFQFQAASVFWGRNTAYQVSYLETNGNLKWTKEVIGSNNFVFSIFVDSKFIIQLYNDTIASINSDAVINRYKLDIPSEIRFASLNNTLWGISPEDSIIYKYDLAGRVLYSSKLKSTDVINFSEKQDA